jgi:hypothetical protein
VNILTYDIALAQDFSFVLRIMVGGRWVERAIFRKDKG